ncbi:MAG: PepSY-associated TM helix domain-containing protein [Armatimonadota bacterium]
MNSVKSANIAPRPLNLRVHSAIRWMHTYISLITLLIVLFFSVTGLTLNHTEWSSGGVGQRDVAGNVDIKWLNPAAPDKLNIAEKLRQDHSLRGHVDEIRIDDRECTVMFKAPGYAADAFINVKTGQYQMTIAEEGKLAVMNDLHKGRHSGKLWGILIDASAVLLTVTSITGLGLLFFLKRIRTGGLVVVAAGAVFMIVMVILTLR